jgi:hypothetical protein
VQQHGRIEEGLARTRGEEWSRLAGGTGEERRPLVVDGARHSTLEQLQHHPERDVLLELAAHRLDHAESRTAGLVPHDVEQGGLAGADRAVEEQRRAPTGGGQA